MLSFLENERFSKTYIKRRRGKKSIKIILIYLIFIVLFIYLSIYFHSFKKNLIKNYETIINQNDKLIKKIQKLEKAIGLKHISYSFNNSTINEEETEIFDSELEKKYIDNQHHFCQSNDLFIDKEIDNKTKKVRAHSGNISFETYVHKSDDHVSDSISGSGPWESSSTRKTINRLNYHSQKKKSSKKETTVLDIGANVGRHSFYSANDGHKLHSPEAPSINSHISKKNFCPNENINTTSTNKGTGPKEEKCLSHHPSHNIGNDVILRGENAKTPRNTKNLTEEVEFTKLSNYYDFLSEKNIALIKLDVEGSEGKVINSGIEFISKYHVPFLIVEFNNDYLKLQGTDPKKILEIFEQNGYLFSKGDFFVRHIYLLTKF